jgi:hypothetical protein
MSFLKSKHGAGPGSGCCRCFRAHRGSHRCNRVPP